MFSNYNTMSKFKFIKGNNKNNIITKRKQKPKRVLNYYHTLLRSYIYGLVHPELAVNSSNIPKAPNYVAIPTSNITFREAFDIEPDKNGEFILYWTPNFLATEAAIQKRSNYACKNYSRNWLGTFSDVHNEFGYYPVAAYSPPASFVKYRLVSAGCKITYKGPVIQRAGIISHCLTYKAIPMPYFNEDSKDWIGQSAYDGATDPLIWNNTLQNLDPTTIQNGMWNSIQNVQKNQTVFVCAVPTDPSDFIFEDDAYFYQAATATEELEAQSIHVSDVPEGAQQYDIRMCIQLPQDGTPCSYIFKGTDLSQEAKLYVEQFYNFEVIPTEESAPILRARKGDLTSKELDTAKELATKALDLVRGKSNQISEYLIDDLLNEDSQRASMYSNDNNNFISNQPVQKSKRRNQSSFKNKAKNFGKSILNETKEVLKDVGKQIFTKENIYSLGKDIAEILINQNFKVK